MGIEDIKRTELTPSEREVLEEDKKRWKRLGTGAHLDEWLAFGPGIAIRRRLAMRLAFTNRPEGKAYIKAYNELLHADGFDIKDAKLMSSLTAVQWLQDDAERLNILREIRETMTPGERSRLNSPISAKQRVLAVLQARHGGTEEKLKTSPVAILKAKHVELTHEIEHLKEQLAAVEHRDGSLFDLKHDKPEDIATTIVASVSETKARNIAKAITDGIAAKRQQRKPAG
jgi:hypothetical protein